MSGRAIRLHKKLRNERRIAQEALQKQQNVKQPQPLGSLPGPAPTLIPAQPGRIDKSAPTIGEPKRLRDRAHLQFVASKPCLICGRQPCDPHHLRFAQPRVIGMKVSDEFTVPLCRGHHRQLHQVGNEQAWWAEHNISPLPITRELWEQTHPNVAKASQSSEVSIGGT